MNNNVGLEGWMNQKTSVAVTRADGATVTGTIVHVGDFYFHLKPDGPGKIIAFPHTAVRQVQVS